MNRWFLLCVDVSVAMAAEYSAADRSFSVQVPVGWHIRQAAIAGKELHVAEPDAGGPEKVFLGAGFATARNLQELSHQAAGFAAQFVPGLRLTGAPQLGQVPRNSRLEQAVLGNWVLDDNQSSGLGTSSSVMTMSHWKLTFLPNGRFQSSKEMFTSSSQGDHGGSVGAGGNHAGTFAIYGNTLVADITGAGRQTYQVWVGGGELKLNGMLFLRP